MDAMALPPTPCLSTLRCIAAASDRTQQTNACFPEKRGKSTSMVHQMNGDD
jgi:hypothetical protein